LTRQSGNELPPAVVENQSTDRQRHGGCSSRNGPLQKQRSPDRLLGHRRGEDTEKAADAQQHRRESCSTPDVSVKRNEGELAIDTERVNRQMVRTQGALAAMTATGSRLLTDRDLSIARFTWVAVVVDIQSCGTTLNLVGLSLAEGRAGTAVHHPA
jgi:hypothetical protein